MKKSIVVAVISLLVFLTAGIGIWYFTPTVFLKNVEPEDIAQIVVFNGNTGNRFIVSDSEEIACIIENIQNTKMRRDKISTGYSGSQYHLYCKDENGEEITMLIVNSSSTIRKDPFFYRAENGELCSDYLRNLEEKYCENSD